MSKGGIYLMGLLISASVSINAQTHGMGCVYNPEEDGKVPQRAKLMTRDYALLPDSYSLKEYCPTPDSQGTYGTCSAWSTAYAARTICEAISNGWINQDTITDEAFSPIFVYKQLATGLGCNDGVSITGALNILKNKGTAKLRSFDVLCADSIPEVLYAEASNYKIDGYTSLFNNYCYDNDSDKVIVVKKALTENHPVVFAMNVYESFDKCDSLLWNGVRDEVLGLHAMCVIGYDDKKYGGAFEIMNSWGTDWAGSGYVWITYEDFNQNADYAYDVFLKKKIGPCPTPFPSPNPAPSPNPVPIQKQYSMSGAMRIIERDGGSPSVFKNENQFIPSYNIEGNYLSGKKFRLLVSNHVSAWVYVIASDLENNVTKLFPYADNISAYLNYAENNIVIPDETHEFELDSNPGTDYFCVLYSQEELDINSIVDEIRHVNGSFYDKLKTVLGNKLAPTDDIQYITKDMCFSAHTDYTIVPLIVEISHVGMTVDYKP